MSESSEKSFTGIRAVLWPIHRFELKKFVPMSLLIMLILLNYTILRNLKDGLVVSAGGASVIPFLKGYVVFPASILFVAFYGKLVDWLSREAVFYTVCSGFLAYILVFVGVLYPLQDYVHPAPETVAAWKASMPALQHFFSIAATWSYSVSYIISELWGSAMNSLLFWQFANMITRTSEAKRFYTLFILFGNVGSIGAGLTVKFGKLFSTTTSEYLNIVCGIVLISGICVMALYRYICQNVLTDPKLYDPSATGGKKKKKAKMSFGQSIAFLARSQYLRMIAMLVFCYGVSINLIELLWKNQLKAAFPNPVDYTAFMGNLSIGTGIATIFVVLFSGRILSLFGWFWGALATPAMVLITACAFFGFMFCGEMLDPMMASMGMSVLMAGVIAGTIQNVLSKSIKYGLFDPTKEMAYIPLDDDSKSRGKAAIDVVGARLGKASGGYVASVIMMITASGIDAISGYLAVVVLAILGAWIYAVSTLSKLYNAKIAETTES